MNDDDNRPPRVRSEEEEEEMTPGLHLVYLILFSIFSLSTRLSDLYDTIDSL